MVSAMMSRKIQEKPKVGQKGQSKFLEMKLATCFERWVGVNQQVKVGSVFRAFQVKEATCQRHGKEHAAHEELQVI